MNMVFFFCLYDFHSFILSRGLMEHVKHPTYEVCGCPAVLCDVLQRDCMFVDVLHTHTHTYIHVLSVVQPCGRTMQVLCRTAH